jgi:hypothetical protein
LEKLEEGRSMRTVVALVSIDVDTTAEATGMLLLSIARQHHVVNSFLDEHILTLETKTS